MWLVTNKGDVRCRELADRHYTRQRPGFPMFCRPGYNHVLYYSDIVGGAVFVWWRPKWEDGRPGTERKDKLRAIECTLFRNESGFLSSTLIKEAVLMLPKWNRFVYAEDGLITGVGSEQTKKRRGKGNLPGHCFRVAGWVDFDHAKGKADTWLYYPCPNPNILLIK